MRELRKPLAAHINQSFQVGVDELQYSWKLRKIISMDDFTVVFANDKGCLNYIG